MEWLAKKTREPYRLLTEAEWEYAARAGTKGPRYWNDGADACGYESVYDKQGEGKHNWEKFNMKRESFGCDDGYPETAPVGMFLPNQFGLHDMLGNVGEWTEDCYQDSYSGNLADGTPRDCESRMFRGGSWILWPQDVRLAYRNRNTPDFRYNDLGFRVARTLTP